MSSFVVSKQEFVKAAGLMHGIESAKRHKHLWFIENVRKDFDRAYELNVYSVNEQYGDKMKPETASYDTLFERYSKLGTMLYQSDIFGNGDEFNKFRPMMMSFFNSVLYQIEDEEMHKEVSSIFYGCVRKLYDKEVENVDGCWGRIEI